MANRPLDPMTAALVAARRDSRRSQADIGQEAGVSQTAVCYWENGRNLMGPVELAAYAKAVGRRWALIDDDGGDAPDDAATIRRERDQFAHAIANLVVFGRDLLDEAAYAVVTRLLAGDAPPPGNPAPHQEG